MLKYRQEKVVYCYFSLYLFDYIQSWEFFICLLVIFVPFYESAHILCSFKNYVFMCFFLLVFKFWMFFLKMSRNLKILHIKIWNTLWPSDSTSGWFIQKKIQTLIWKDICIPMFIGVLFIIARVWKQLKCPSIDD